jgi:mono/diheme cytochrome c family protein
LRRLRDSRAARAVPLAVAIAALSAFAAGCGREEEDLVNGKALFVEECGTCHQLARAGTAGTQGPNLDTAFVAARESGLGEETFQGVVYDQILEPGRDSEMPAKLVTGDDARDVAAYVAESAAVPGDDTGALASAGLAGAETGEQIFTAGGCAGCHTFEPAGSTGDVGPPLDDVASQPAQQVEESIVDPDAEVVQGYSAGTMPSTYADQLDEEQLGLLVEYLQNPEGG